MKIISARLGNFHHDAEWTQKIASAHIDQLEIDQWTSQKSRFVGKTADGVELAISLPRHQHICDGDILDWNPETNVAIIARTKLNKVMVIDMQKVLSQRPQIIVQTCVELGHALGNQHWPAVVKGCKVYVPVTVDPRVVLSVMKTHRFEFISFDIISGEHVIPYLAPHETRRLFGGAEQESHGLHDHSHLEESDQHPEESTPDKDPYTKVTHSHYSLAISVTEQD